MLDEHRRMVFVECDKAVYGLKDAPLLWHLRLIYTLKQLGLRKSSLDSCVWMLICPTKKSLKLILSIHVDDSLVGGTEESIKWLHSELETRFGKMKAESKHFKLSLIHI